MTIDIQKLKDIGKNIQTIKTHSNIQPKVLAIIKLNSKDKKALTQKEVSTILSKQLKRDIRPQQARNALLALVKKNVVVRRVLEQPDENGNYVFFYLKE